MEKGNEKKGFINLWRITDLLQGNKGTKKSSCCGSFELEEIPDESLSDKEDSQAPVIGSSKVKKSSCCGGFELEEIPDESVSDKEKKA
jgi:hypothetical protein